MSTDANKFWNDLADKARRAKGFHPLTAEEAQAAYDEAVAESISEPEIDSIVESVVSPRRPDPPASCNTREYGNLETDELVPVLNRNPAPAVEPDDDLLNSFRGQALAGHSTPAPRLDWKTVQNRVAFAQKRASEVLDVLRVSEYPIDPFDIAKSEEPRLQVVAHDFANRFDGQLEYHPQHRAFLLFVNTKYDQPNSHGHSPRTRFSMAHELAHFFIDEHRSFLTRGGKTHASQSEFKAKAIVEKEADAFAASLLMPDRLFSPLANEEELTLSRIEWLANEFKTSLVSTAIRSVEVSHFPCAVAGLRKGRVAWQALAEPLIRGGCYPGPKDAIGSPTALERWAAFVAGDTKRFECEQYARHWFRTFDRDDLQTLPVTEHYLPVPVMETLVVFLTVPEQELFADSDD